MGHSFWRAGTWLVIAAVMMAPLVLRTASAAAPLTVPQHIAADCSADVSQALADWIKSVPDGSTIQFAQDACYRVDRPLVITHRSGLTFEGRGAKFKRVSPTPPELEYPQKNQHWQFIGGSNITMRNMSVEGLNVTSSAPRGFEPDKFASWTKKYAFECAYCFYGTDGVVLEHLSADAVYGDGLYLDRERNGPHSRNVRVTHLSVDRNGRQGIALVAVENALLDNVWVLHSALSGIDLEPYTAAVHVQHVEIRNSYVNAQDLAFPSLGVGDVSDVFIHDNTIRYSVPSWPWLVVGHGRDTPRRHDWRVHHNIVMNRRMKDSLEFRMVDNVDVRDNVSPMGGRYVGVRFNDGGGVIKIVGNDFAGAVDVYQGRVSETSHITACHNRWGANAGFGPPCQ